VAAFVGVDLEVANIKIVNGWHVSEYHIIII
jgi:hypothetical protein